MLNLVDKEQRNKQKHRYNWLYTQDSSMLLINKRVHYVLTSGML